ncbi:hypothetical protein ACH4Y0_38095 [Streptomyces sp. NPDC020707]|uniref:hypothetical protein n=1 Tax=Streptomyces sp. NPDC020707 TaxID=3365084 RepID=UPI00379D6797
MTAHGNERGPGGPIDHDFAGRYEVFAAKVEGALNVEAGLRDILSQSRHEAFTAKVETALSVEAGLRDILTPAADQAPSSPSPTAVPPAANAVPGGSRWQASPAQRLKLRSNPRVIAASRVLRAVGSRIDDSDLALVHVLVLARDRVQALVQALVLVRDRVHDLDLVRDRVLAFVPALDRAFVLVGDRVLDLDRDLDRALALDLDLLYDLARDLARDLALAFDRTRDLAPALDRARDLDRTLFDACTGVIDHVRSQCLRIINDAYAQAVGTPVAVDEESLTNLMDDFTTDDLSDVDVREGDIELAGVRWSDGTTWPASTDIDDLKRRSERQEDGSWIIRAGTGNVRENILT